MDNHDVREQDDTRQEKGREPGKLSMARGLLGFLKQLATAVIARKIADLIP